MRGLECLEAAWRLRRGGLQGQAFWTRRPSSRISMPRLSFSLLSKARGWPSKPRPCQGASENPLSPRQSLAPKPAESAQK